MPSTSSGGLSVPGVEDQPFDAVERPEDPGECGGESPDGPDQSDGEQAVASAIHSTHGAQPWDGRGPEGAERGDQSREGGRRPRFREGGVWRPLRRPGGW